MKYVCLFSLTLLFLSACSDDKSTVNNDVDLDSVLTLDIDVDENIDEDLPDNHFDSDIDPDSNITIDIDTVILDDDADLPDDDFIQEQNDEDIVLATCLDGNTKIESCGFNGHGSIEYSCVDGEWISIDGCINPDKCMNNDSKIVVCGLNGNSSIKYLCTDGQWTIQVECNDPDECTNEDLKEDVCGYNGKVVADYLCVNGKWQLNGECNDPDECTNETTYQEACGYNGKGKNVYLCTDGEWIDQGCSDPDECLNGDTKDELNEHCGYNYSGYYSYTCVDGRWSYRTCNNPDVCHNNDIKTTDEPCGYNNNGTNEYLCTEGLWVYDHCNDPDECTHDDVKNDACGYNGNAVADYLCIGGIWQLTSECNDPDKCKNGAELFKFCGLNNNGLLTQTCVDGQWVDQSECNDPDECKNNNTKSDVCGYNGNATASYICSDGIWHLNGVCNDPDECKNGDLHADNGVVSECRNGHWFIIRRTSLWGTKKVDVGTSLVKDENNNIYVAGYTEGSFQGYNKPSEKDVFLSKLGPDRTVLWTKQWGTGGTDVTYSVIYNSNSLYVMGYNSYCENIFITKLNTDGEKLWEKEWESPRTGEGAPIKMDSEGYLYIAGDTSNLHDDNSFSWEETLYFSKLDSDGNVIWTKRWGVSSSDRIASFDIDGNDNIYITGRTYGVCENCTDFGGVDIYLTKFNKNGEQLWVKQIGTSESDTVTSLDIDLSGNIFILGDTSGSFGSYQTTGLTDIFVIKLNNDGETIWIKQWGTERYDFAPAMSVNVSGDNLYVSGRTAGAFEGSTNDSGYDMFLSKLSGDGSDVTTIQWNLSSTVKYLTTDNNNIYLTGYSYTIDDLAVVNNDANAVLFVVPLDVF